VASRRSAPRRPGPPRWFTELGRAAARERADLLVRQGRLDPDAVPDYVSNAGLRERLNTRDYLTRTVKDLRKFFKGFNASDGYDLTRIETWDANRARVAKQYGSYLHGLQASPNVEVSPTRYRGNKRAMFRRQLQEATQQGSSRQKKYVFHVEQTTRPTDVRLTRQGKLEVREELPDGDHITKRFWYFRDYLPGRRQPRGFDDIIRATIKMLEDLPSHMFFSIINSAHGPIDVPVSKDFLLETLQRYREEYGAPDNIYLHDGFGETLIGVMFIGSREQADARYNAQLRRRMDRERAKSTAAKQRRQRIAFQKRMGRVR